MLLKVGATGQHYLMPTSCPWVPDMEIIVTHGDMHNLRSAERMSSVGASLSRPPFLLRRPSAPSEQVRRTAHLMGAWGWSGFGFPNIGGLGLLRSTESVFRTLALCRTHWLRDVEPYLQLAENVAFYWLRPTGS